MATVEQSPMTVIGPDGEPLVGYKPISKEMIHRLRGHMHSMVEHQGEFVVVHLDIGVIASGIDRAEVAKLARCRIASHDMASLWYVTCRDDGKVVFACLEHTICSKTKKVQ